MNRSQDFSTLLFLHKWWKVLTIIGLSASLLAIFFSSSIFITPLFKSTVIMYPASSSSISKSLLSENAAGKQDILEFGEDEQAEQMLQILNSSRIREQIIDKFNLAEHYGIAEESKFAKTNLYKQYESSITFKRTEYMAVQISVLDKDPKVAAAIANEIAILFDSVKNQMQKERALKGFTIIESEYLSLLAEVNTMEDSLTQLRKLGIHDYESQAEMMNQQLAMEISKGNSRGIKALEEKLEILATYGGPYVSIRDALEYEKKQLSYVKTRYVEAKIDATQEISQKFIIEDAIVAERKVFPNTLVIVVISTMAALLAGIILVYLIDSNQKISKVVYYKEDRSNLMRAKLG
ncbi:hypothetical protein N9934_03085 [Desulfosarcina sp.]|nr:hypothetical protein [Desulfosarcina sp.]